MTCVFSVCFLPPDADLTSTEASGSDSRGDRAELYAHVDEGLLGGEASYLGPPLTPEKDDALHQATAVANLRAALMSKNSLLSLKADVLGDDSSLLLEYLPKGAHSLARKCRRRLFYLLCSVERGRQTVMSRGEGGASVLTASCGSGPLPTSPEVRPGGRTGAGWTALALLHREGGLSGQREGEPPFPT